MSNIEQDERHLPLEVPHNSFFVPLTSHLSSDIHGQRGHQNNLSLSLFCSVLRHVINNFGEGRKVFMTQSQKLQILSKAQRALALSASIKNFESGILRPRPWQLQYIMIKTCFHKKKLLETASVIPAMLKANIWVATKMYCCLATTQINFHISLSATLAFFVTYWPLEYYGFLNMILEQSYWHFN